MPSFVYGLQEKTISEFKNKYGWYPFSKIFPGWWTTICGKTQEQQYGFHMVIKTRVNLPIETVEKYNLTFIKEESE